MGNDASGGRRERWLMSVVPSRGKEDKAKPLEVGEDSMGWCCGGGRMNGASRKGKREGVDRASGV